MINKTKKYQQT